MAYLHPVSLLVSLSQERWLCGTDSGCKDADANQSSSGFQAKASVIENLPIGASSLLNVIVRPLLSTPMQSRAFVPKIPGCFRE